ncbi:WecB/TagA/CpsF family glycosyltransferase [Lysinibacillus sphaericus]|uniref:N-acetylglucosaminyldiphosphoundecaprenol N-acetyl-beta-D-mannosaminyltransferase n=2 Tax=Lysinibacillus TaxID=400634 RepID=W7S5U6_LYSSH|nr:MULTISPECIES: WecB/TagA/CpsF family glycosyltransferase [Lysinibacillus]MBE5082056.1 WecB/TagA/CpsF family glycosyltransferase [Bacillus thuringiensis]UZN00923.1 WecB/TagA/CpsF family glycosyltransferase [Lysinibacillus sp. MHQ-1]AMO31079.1 acetylglucosaminyldiphospho-UDP acetyl-beta-D-mannosaminyltransferase [Lysinibacillus sphaericus]AMR89814.1 acetylglucosaminyldiphospho-UDP acetyl-beta-D-mannosaminyltransferase [Lysinibacillus sphaericus]ANA47885.1 acetylglucosaminyldiphospho-UDP acetyl
MGVPFLHISQQGFVDLLVNRIEQQEKTFVVTANPEVVMQANENPTVKGYLNQATYICADGIGVVKAAQILGDSLPERVTGYDTMVKLLEVGQQKRFKVYLLGAQKETIEKTIANIHKNYPNVEVVGYQDGFFDWNNNHIADDIAALQPDLVFVALGVPRQEKWITENLDKFSKGVFIGVGGSFDVIAGTVKRAPVIWQKLNLEWLYRLLRQPSRFIRMLVLPRFALKVFSLKLRGQGTTK